MKNILLLLTITGVAFAQKDAKGVVTKNIDAKAIYLDKCAVCHGQDGSGNTAKGRKLKMKGVKETAAKMMPEEMIKIVTDGKGADMDAFGKELGTDQVKAVVAYYRGLAK